MERKIGEIFEYNGEWYQCVEGEGCYKCDFNTSENTCEAENPYCAYRNDGKDVIFKKLEKVGEPITVKDRTFQKLTSDNTSCKECVFNIPNKACYKNDYIDGHCPDREIWIEIKQNKKDMEEKNNGNTPLNVLTDKYVNGDICYDDFEKEVKALYSCKEEIKPNLKEFDLEAAKAGKPVYTRDRRKARIICFDKSDKRPIVALISDNGSEFVYEYLPNGKSYNGKDDSYDLVMLPEKKEGWVNVYKDDDYYTTTEEIYESKEEAIKHNPYEEAYLTTVKIEWEE